LACVIASRIAYTVIFAGLRSGRPRRAVAGFNSRIER
jgi:hypothetical protein